MNNLTKLAILVIFTGTNLIALSSAAINFRIPIPFPFSQFSLPKSLTMRQAPRPASRPAPAAHHSHKTPHRPHMEHSQVSQQSQPQQLSQFSLSQSHLLQQKKAAYLHDPDSDVNFYFKENLYGPSKRVDIHHDGCREVPIDAWHQKPKSLWAKHCITLYQNGHCKGEGIQVAGMVHELRSAGLHYGATSFQPCDKNIRIRFVNPEGNQLYHSDHHHQVHHHNHRRY